MKAPSPAVIEAALDRLKRRLADWGAEKIIVFGSVARGDYSGQSDIDLIVVKPTGDRLPQRICDALEECWATNPPLPVEPWVYTPEEFARLVVEENPFVTEAVRHGRVLHEQA